jgi:hypothetical protein
MPQFATGKTGLPADMQQLMASLASPQQPLFKEKFIVNVGTTGSLLIQKISLVL